MRHFIDIKDFTREQLLQLLQVAQGFIEHDKIRDQALLTGATVCNLFFESSTRTHASFDLAAQKLNAHVLNLDINNSSANKGETVIDTVLNLQAMGVDIFVLRHPHQNMQQVADVLAPQVRLVSAGEGCGSHPSQGLLDVLTIQQYKKSFDNLRVAIVGDIFHSRVARSTISALQILGCKNIAIVGPENLLPNDISSVHRETELKQGLQDADVVMMLRIQKERMSNKLIHDAQEYINHYQLNEKTLAYAKPDAIIMHPGPMNRGVEITDEVAESEQSVILQQVRNGVAARMAILSTAF